ncbi:MAG: GntR family transcriptional regulator [Kiritimatiellae bacterium]|nr:GntR family transcriptional regulator [Kiritimatiellia bacterium]
MAAKLSAEIRAGKYAVRRSFPSLTKIMRRFGVTRVTAMRSVDELKRLGVVAAVPKSGIVVKRAASQKIGLVVPREAGAPVGLYGEGLHPRQALERAVQGRCAHCEYRGHVLARLYQRDALLVFAHDARQLGDEVGRAGAADGLPDPPGVRERVVGVCPAPALAFAVADVPGHELDDVFARVA